MERTWGSVAALKFGTWPVCPTAGPNYHEVLTYKASTTLGDACDGLPDPWPIGGTCGNSADGAYLHLDSSSYMPGNVVYDNTYLGTYLQSDGTYNVYDLDKGAVHEIGHMLGFDHESYNTGNIQGHSDYCSGGGTGPNHTSITAYDNQSIMSYCRSEDDGTLTDLDISGVQFEYGKRPVTADSDGDGKLDYLDNCPYVPNGGQENANLEGEYQHALDLGSPWGLKEGQPPSANDTDDAAGYITHWRKAYPGDVCDPTPVSVVNTSIVSGSDSGPCVDKYVGAYAWTSPPDYTRHCSAQTTTGLTFSGIRSDRFALAVPQVPNGASGPAYCDCPYANDSNPANVAKCSDPNLQYKCLFGRDALFPNTNGTTQPPGNWGRITNYVPCQGIKCLSPWGSFTTVSTTFASPERHYVGGTNTWAWDFAGAGYSPNDLQSFGHPSNAGTMTGFLWTHVTNPIPTTGTANLQNHYLALTAVQSFGEILHWVAPVKVLWTPGGWGDPVNIHTWGQVPFDGFAPVQAGGVMVVQLLNGQAHDVTTRYSAAAQAGLSPVANGGADLLVAAEKTTQQLPRSTTPVGIILDAGTTRLRGVLTPNGATLDFQAPTSTIATQSATPWRVYSSEQNRLFSLEVPFLVTRDVATYMAGGGTPSLGPITGAMPDQVKAIAYNPTLNSIDVMDITAGQLRLLSIAIPSVANGTAVATEVWRTQVSTNLPANVFLTTTLNGEIVASWRSQVTNVFEAVAFRADGTPLLSYQGQGSLAAGVVLRPDGFTAPLSQTPSDALSNLNPVFTPTSSAIPGLCGASWFKSQVGDQRTSPLGVPLLECATIQNGGFETGSWYPWATSGASAAISTTAHTGGYSAMLGATTPTNGDSSIRQTLTVPQNGGSLTFSYKNVCPDTVTYDWFQVQIQSPSGAALATVVGNTCSNTSVWSPVAFDMTAYAGQNVVLVMTNHDDNYAGDPTYTLVDDISLY